MAPQSDSPGGGWSMKRLSEIATPGDGRRETVHGTCLTNMESWNSPYTTWTGFSVNWPLTQDMYSHHEISNLRAFFSEEHRAGKRSLLSESFAPKHTVPGPLSDTHSFPKKRVFMFLYTDLIQHGTALTKALWAIPCGNYNHNTTFCTCLPANASLLTICRVSFCFRNSLQKLRRALQKLLTLSNVFMRLYYHEDKNFIASLDCKYWRWLNHEHLLNVDGLELCSLNAYGLLFTCLIL